MNSIMLGVFTILAIRRASAFVMNASGQNVGYGAVKPEANLIMSHLQSKINNDSIGNGKMDDCGARDNRIIEGVSVIPSDPMTEQFTEMERKQKCIATKIKAQQEFNKKVTKLIQETASDSKKDFRSALDKKNCVSKLDRGNHECFIKNVLKDFYTSVVWKVAVHDNVAQLWYHDKLALMIVFENVEYNIHPEEQECFTFFPTSNVAAEENALGHIVNIVGKPATPKSNAESCRPCSDFAKDNKTVEGAAVKCTNSCDPSNALFTSSNFKVKRKDSKESNSSRTSKNETTDASKNKEE